MIIVSWNGHTAAVEDTGAILDASSQAARRELEQALSIPIVKQSVYEGQEYVEELAPGQTGYVVAALERLGAILTLT